MELVLQQKQKLNLMMTVELRQAISLLQYSTIDLYHFIRNQESENPLIELVEKEEQHFTFERNSKLGSTDYSKKNPIDFVANNEEDERKRLTEQVRWLDIAEQERNILLFLVHNLDANGYLPLTVAEISTLLQIDEKAVKNGITLLQQLEPIGVGARNLSECLLLQLNYYYPEEEVVEQIVINYLEDLANKKWQAIAKSLDISLTEVKAAFDLIRTLNPRPCILESRETEYLYPDIILEKNDGKLDVYLNDGYLPKINFNSQYTDRLYDKSDLNYVQDKFRSYQMLVNSIEQRRSTILKITEAVLQKQSAFFNEGFKALKPLTLKEIADEINMHESTISRATSNKTLQTPEGTFDFRIFFTSKLETEDGNSTSQTKVKLLLEEYIKEENKYKPHSDQKIADYFKTKKGITISRRTVAKYREELNIPSSSKRKEIRI
ncbi:RNA polymerase sigma-54 factor [Oceanobacillus chungangensis]|uniref:RNA polymerase sigma-54 factor n=1 Tax=Oceanobacillus chungangensis TaxID=1229152 RepID=A0A3D8PJL0_9BACI|nr:RNA polymerase sigma-54 factor [Oceanobacillus chungangensis]